MGIAYYGIKDIVSYICIINSVDLGWYIGIMSALGVIFILLFFFIAKKINYSKTGLLVMALVYFIIVLFRTWLNPNIFTTDILQKYANIDIWSQNISKIILIVFFVFFMYTKK